ncbi:GNAT family N-acetyltransferase [Agromyces aurantiacus]|uniref:GNAT family N-acetyltransferase n=1 Tax=Agromyces aurantiacus TaxID=165814 RepID=A0ABV9R7B4_9MICO|nr:GNAT family N-acetyltransferase [Agromyces aurantiacus]MBM7503868.1 mycothiol synthase [Agromyces aurantiacus]
MPPTEPAGTPTLAERLGAIDPPAADPHPDVATWRPATLDDLDDLVDLHAASARVDHPHWTQHRDELAEQLRLPHVDAVRDTLVGVGRDGRLVAHGAVICPPGRETMVRVFLFGVVHPDVRRRGVGGALLDWQLARAREQLAATGSRLPGWIMAYVEQGVTDAASLLERAGLVPTRHFSTLERDLAAPVAAARPLPAGVRIQPWSERWSESARLARNAAFADHWGSQSTDAESWRLMTAETAFAPSLSFLAVAPDAEADGGERVVAFVVALRNEEDWEGQGFTSAYVRLVGVVREHRGQGLAQALLARHLVAAAEAGLERSTLDVDAENPTGALRLYAGMGYEVAHRHTSHVLVC